MMNKFCVGDIVYYPLRNGKLRKLEQSSEGVNYPLLVGKNPLTSHGSHHVFSTMPVVFFATKENYLHLKGLHPDVWFEKPPTSDQDGDDDWYVDKKRLFMVLEDDENGRERQLTYLESLGYKRRVGSSGYFDYFYDILVVNDSGVIVAQCSQFKNFDGHDEIVMPEGWVGDE